MSIDRYRSEKIQSSLGVGEFTTLHGALEGCFCHRDICGVVIETGSVAKVLTWVLSGGPASRIIGITTENRLVSGSVTKVGTTRVLLMLSGPTDQIIRVATANLLARWQE